MKLRKFSKNKENRRYKSTLSTPLHIWIDGYEANVPQRLGSSQVAAELLKNLEQIDKKNFYTILLPNKPLDDLPKEREGWRYQILRPRKLWTRIALPLALLLAKKKPDLFFTPTHYLPRFSKVKKIVTIFDLSYLHFPEMFLKKDLWKLKNWTKDSIEQSHHIITISNFTKKDIIKNYKVDRKKITVVYPGYDTEKFKMTADKKKVDEVLQKYNIEGSYIIYIGTLQPRKNLVRLIEAFASVVKQSERTAMKELKLVIVGKTSGLGRSGWMYEEILKAPAKFQIEENVVFTGFVPTEDLPYLLNGAIAFVLPSLYEGFGIPAVESMACGTPVIVSNVSSLPEVVGKAGLLIDPYSVDQIAQAIRTIVTDKKLRAQKSKEGLKQATKYSWRKMAREVLKVFEKMRG